MQHSNRTNSEQGSVLFYILIAVALLGALSYAVASSSRSSGGNIDGERASLAASEILEYSNVVGNAVAQLRLRGCSDTQISFENEVSPTDYSNGNAPVDGSCNVFNIAGGGVTYLPPKAEWLDDTMSANAYYSENLIAGTACIDQVGTGTSSCNSAGIPATELLFVIPYIHEEICSEINSKLGVTPPNTAPPVVTSISAIGAGSEFLGSYILPVRIMGAGNIFDGVRSACAELNGAPAGDYIFYKVLLAR